MKFSFFQAWLIYVQDGECTLVARKLKNIHFTREIWFTLSCLADGTPGFWQTLKDLMFIMYNFSISSKFQTFLRDCIIIFLWKIFNSFDIFDFSNLLLFVLAGETYDYNELRKLRTGPIGAFTVWANHNLETWGPPYMYYKPWIAWSRSKNIPIPGQKIR